MSDVNRNSSRAPILDLGAVVADRFEVTELEMHGAPVQSVLARDLHSNRSVRLYLARLKGADVDTATIERRLTRASRFVHKNVVPSISSGRIGDVGFLAQAVVEGRLLREHLVRRNIIGKPFGITDAVNLVGHICNGLQFARENLRHHTLTPASIFVLKSGRVQIGGFGFDGTRGRRIDERPQLDEWSQGYFTSGIVADPDLAALGLITLQILTSQPWPQGLRAALAEVVNIEPGLRGCIARCLGPFNGDDAHADPSAFRRALKRAGEHADTSILSGEAQIRQADTSAPVSSRLDESLDQVEISGLHSVIDDSFSVPPLAGPGVQGDELSALRWLVEREGVDYGPYTAQQLLEQLENDKLSPSSVLCDLEADRRGTLAEFELFEDKLTAWASRKQDRDVAQREAHQIKTERRKKTLTWGSIAIILGGLASIGGGWAYYQSTLPDPIKGHLDLMVAPMEWALPSIEVSNDESHQEQQIAKSKKKRRRASGQVARGESSSERAQIRREEQLAANSNLELGSGTGAAFDRVAFDRVINRRMRGIYRCLQSEVMRRPSVRALKLSVAVLPDGRLINAKLNGASVTGERCVRGVLRGARVPAFDGTNVKITLPYRFE